MDQQNARHQRLLDRIEQWLTLDKALFVALFFLPFTLAAEIAGIWSVPDLRWKFPLGHDFVAFWAAARLYAEGGLSALYDLPRFAALQDTVSVRPGLLLWHYPPVYLMLILPLAPLSFGVGWAVFQTGGLIALAGVARRLFPVPGYLGWAALFGAPVIAVTLIQGQNGTWFAAILIAGLIAREDGRHGLAALFFALLLAKPQIGALVPVALIARRDYRTFGLTIGATVCLALLTTAVLGLESWQAFFANASALKDALSDPELLAQMPTVFAAASLLGLSPEWAMITQAVAALATLTLTWRAWSDPACPANLRLAMLLFAVLLIPPYGFRYDMVITLAATLLLAREAVSTGWLRGERLGIAFLWVWPAAFPAVALISSVQTGPALLILGMWLVWRRIKSGSSSARSAST